MAVVFKSYEIVLIRVFLHAEFNATLKTEIKYFFLRNMQKTKKKIFIIITFYFL